MKLFSILSLALLFSQPSFTMERRSQALTNLSNQTNSLSNAADEFAQAAARLHERARAEQNENRRAATILGSSGDLCKNAEHHARSSNHSAHATAVPAVNATQSIMQRSNEIRQRLSELEKCTPSAATNAEQISLLAEMARLTKEGVEAISRENACSATLTRATTQSCPLINSLVPDAAIQAARVKDEAIRETINKGNSANKNARKWFFFSLAGFSFTFFSWKYNWMPEKATYACGAASTFFGLKTLQWSCYKLQAYKKLVELRKK